MPRLRPRSAASAALAALCLGPLGTGCAEGTADDDTAGEVLDDDTTPAGDDDSSPDWGPIESFGWRTPWWEDDPNGDGGSLDIRNWRYRTNGRLFEWNTLFHGSVTAGQVSAGVLYQVGGDSVLLWGEGEILAAEQYDSDGILVDSWTPATAYFVEDDGGFGFGGEMTDFHMIDPYSGDLLPTLAVVTASGEGDYFLDLVESGGYYSYQNFMAPLGPPAPDLEMDGMRVVDDFSGDGELSAGESATLLADMTNIGDKDSEPGVQATVSIVSNSTAEATLDSDTASVDGGDVVEVREEVSTSDPGFRITVSEDATTSQYISFSVTAQHPDGTLEGVGTFFFTIN